MKRVFLVIMSLLAFCQHVFASIANLPLAQIGPKTLYFLVFLFFSSGTVLVYLNYYLKRKLYVFSLCIFTGARRKKRLCVEKGRRVDWERAGARKDREGEGEREGRKRTRRQSSERGAKKEDAIAGNCLRSYFSSFLGCLRSTA